MSTPQEERTEDLHQLQREYRHMELNRRAYAEETHAILKRQQATIEKLHRDNEAIKGEIAMIMRHQNKPVSAVQQEMIQRLQDQGDQYATSVDLERRNFATIMEQIGIMRQKVLHQKKMMGGVNAARENQMMIQKQIRILENRLEKALVKFNEAIAHNKDLREEIDDLRRERVVFDNLYHKMESELQKRKQSMAEIIELSNLSYEQRDNYQMEIAAIEQANRKEQEEFEDQMLELGRLLEDELRLPEEKRVGSAQGGQMGSLSVGEEAHIKRRVNAGAWAVAVNKVDIAASMERVDQFEAAFQKIKAATGLSDIGELVRVFCANEDQNFSLFNYVNEQSNEIEKLEEQLQALREEEQRYTQESGEDANQHKQILKELETKLQQTESMAERYDSKCQDAQRIIEALKRGIAAAFDSTECSAGPDMLADTTVTEANMVQYLGMVEDRANEVLQEYADVRDFVLATADAEARSFDPNAADAAAQPLKDTTGQQPESKSAVSVLGVGPQVPMGADHVHVNPPKLDEYSSEEGSEDEEDLTRPLTRDELKQRTLNRLHRRGFQQSGGNGGGAGGNTGGGGNAGGGGTGDASKGKRGGR